MTTNRKKDAVTLYEVLGRTALKTQKNDPPTPQPATKPAEGSSIPTMNNRVPLRAPIAGSIRPPPPTSATPSPAAVEPKDVRSLASAAQLSPEPVLLDQIMARFRPWILVVLAGIVALVLALVIIISTGGPKTKPLETILIPSNPSTSDVIQPQLIPGKQPPAAPTAPVTPPVHQPALVKQSQQSRVIPASQVIRSPDRWYLVILTTSPRYVRAAADFIARHDVSVTIENGPHNSKCVISVQGFRHRAGAAAIAFRRKVVHIGTLLPDARRSNRSDFNTAYYAHVQRSQ